MNWDFFDVFDIGIDVLDLFGKASASSKKNGNEKAPSKKKTEYLIEKASFFLLLLSFILLFFIFKHPLPAEGFTETLIIGSLIGLAIALVFFFILYSLEKYYFKNVFQWLFFSGSVTLFFISLVFCLYFKSRVFI